MSTVSWARFKGIGTITRVDIEDMRAEIRKLRRLAKLVLTYDRDWHDVMFDGMVIEPKEVAAWDKIVTIAGKE